MRMAGGFSSASRNKDARPRPGGRENGMRGRVVLAGVEGEGQFVSPSGKGVRGPGGKAVRRQLDLILGSGDFDASRRSREFLRFIVEETLAGRGEQLTQGVIATAVFGRREGFDPIVDPIVRIQAG